MKDKWLKDLKDRMSEFEMDVPDNLWEEIERIEHSRLPNSGGKGRAWLKIMSGIAAMVAILILITLFFLAPNTPELYVRERVSQIGDNLGKVNHIQDPIGNNLHDSMASEASIKGNGQFETAYEKTPSSDAFKNCNKENRIAEKNESEEQWLEGETNTVSESAEPTETKNFEATREVKHIKGAESDKKMDKCLPDRRYSVKEKRNTGIASVSTVRSPRFSINIFSARGTNSTILNRSISEGLTSNGTNETNETEWDDSPLVGILVSNQGKEIQTKKSHRQPIRMGLSVSYKLTDRLGIATGVTYTNLTSDLKTGSESYYISGEQELHYIGIPVNLTYDIYSWKRLRLYGSGGILVEKCIYGKSMTRYYLDKSDVTEEREDTGIKPLQYSLNLSSGIQFNLTKLLGIYAEPGMSYYFNDGTALETVYKENPLNFNINIGVRLTIDR